MFEKGQQVLDTSMLHMEGLRDTYKLRACQLTVIFKLTCLCACVT